MLADIYLGKITKWNDPAIAELNPGVKLPADPDITVVHRSDGSGTTFILTNYLSKVSPEWKDKVGEGTSVAWPAGVGGKGNEGVAAYVQRIKGSIGYVEYAYALQNKMTYAQVQNTRRQIRQPDDGHVQGRRRQRRLEEGARLLPDLTDQPGKNAWPITGATFILMHKSRTSRENAAEVLKFFDWAYQERRQAGGRARLRAAAGQRHVAQIEDYVEVADQGRVGQGGSDRTAPPAARCAPAAAAASDVARRACRRRSPCTGAFAGTARSLRCRTIRSQPRLARFR